MGVSRSGEGQIQYALYNLVDGRPFMILEAAIEPGL
jgi:hypothetical protein